MTEGLITRIGRWLDRKWEAKVTEGQLKQLENAVNEVFCAKAQTIEAEMAMHGKALADTIKQTLESLKRVEVMEHETLALKEEILKALQPKEAADLKKRLEQLELYVGMKRVADPTKPPVAKSAFSM